MTRQPPRDADLLTLNQVADRLQISRWLVYRLIDERELTSITLGRRRLIAVSELQRFVADQQQRAEDAR